MKTTAPQTEEHKDDVSNSKVNIDANNLSGDT